MSVPPTEAGMSSVWMPCSTITARYSASPTIGTMVSSKRTACTATLWCSPSGSALAAADGHAVTVVGPLEEAAVAHRLQRQKDGVEDERRHGEQDRLPEVERPCQRRRYGAVRQDQRNGGKGNEDRQIGARTFEVVLLLHVPQAAP